METIPGVEWPKFEIILAALAEQLEQLVKQKWCGNHRRAGIMAKATPFKDLRTPANGLQPVDKRDRIATRTHPQGGGNTAKPGANHKNVAFPRCGGGPGRFGRGC